MTKESVNSLTSFTDARRPGVDSMFRPSDEPSLTKAQTKKAMSDLYVNREELYPKVERAYMDPMIKDQNNVLFSFLPCRGATPNKDGIFGMIKIRGVFSDDESANKHAEYLITNIDSFHPIITGYVGRPFPLMADAGSLAVDGTVEIDIKKKVEDETKNHIINTRKEDRDAIKEIKERERLLQEQNIRTNTEDLNVASSSSDMPQVQGEVVQPMEEDFSDPAQILYTYEETTRQLAEYKKLLTTNEDLIHNMNQESSEYEKTYVDKYMYARKQAGFTNEEANSNFMKFINNNDNLNELINKFNK
eukprot:Pgem_evm2s5899